MSRNERLVREVAKIWRGGKERKRKCIISECEENAIGSHVLQKNGVISLLCENRHFYVMEVKDFFKIKTPFELPVQYRKIGINEGLSFPIYCNPHDTELFNEIEIGEYDAFAYAIQLLFAYRGICKELRKKEIQIDIQGGFLNSPVYRTEARAERIEQVNILLQGYILGVKDLEFYMKELEHEINRVDTITNPKFTFVTVELNRLDVCTSTIFSPTDYSDVTAKQEDSLNTIMISIFPKQDKTIIICGYHNEHFDDWMENYIEAWREITNEEAEKRISNILIKRCETWGMSPQLFTELGEDKRELILKEFMEDVMNHDQNMETEINIFDN